MKMVKLKFNVWMKIVKKLRECMRANKTLNEEIRAFNEIRESKND